MSEINFRSAGLNPQIEQLQKDYLSPSDLIEVKTSGSTGLPKTISLRKEHLQASALKTLEFLKIAPGDRALLCLSPERIGGIMMVIRAIEGRLKLVVTEPSSTPLSEVEGEFDFAAMVPLQVQQSLGELHRVRNLIIGGAPIDAALEEKIKGFSTNIFHTYGMTETISHVAMRRINGADAEEAYRALPGISFSQDERQCLVIDAKDIGVEHLHTNDVVELLDTKSFKWKGRFDNVVNSGGVKLHPEQLEKKLGDIGFEYILAGVPDKLLGQKLVMISPADNASAEIHRLKKLLSGLGKYEKPKILYHAPVLKTENGKTRRKATVEGALRLDSKRHPL